MPDLDHVVISKILGSKNNQVGPVGIGNSSAMSSMEEIQEALRNDVPGVEPTPSSFEQDDTVAQASDSAREGAPPDHGSDDNEGAERKIL